MMHRDKCGCRYETNGTRESIDPAGMCEEHKAFYDRCKESALAARAAREAAELERDPAYDWAVRPAAVRP